MTLTKRRKTLTFNVDGEEWEIVTRSLGYRSVFPLGGIVYPKQRRIALDPALTRDQRRVTMFHELGHAAFSKAGLQGKWSDRLEETVVEGITTWLFVILRDNPRLAEYIVTGREEGL